jgi:PAS domain S-box-containing protein
MERCKPGYTGSIYTQKLAISMEPSLAKWLQTVLDSDGPATFGPGADYPLSDKAVKRYGVKSMLTMALFPRVGKPWLFGLHRCSHAETWTSEDKTLFRGIGRRLEDALSSLLAYHNLKESEERYRLIAENTADTISVFDLNLKPIYTSPSVLKLRGYTAQDAMTQSLDQIFTSESLQKVEKVFTEGLALEEKERGKTDPSSSALIELEQYCKDGSTIWVELATSALRGDNLQPTGILTVARDITERKRVQKALTLFRSLIDHANDMIEIVDPETGRYLDVNERACLAHGYTRAEYLALTVPQIDPVMTEQSWKKVMQQLRRDGSFILESQHQRKDGSIFPIEINIDYIRLDRDYVLSIVRDITGRKQADEALRDSEERYRALYDENPSMFFTLDAEGTIISVNDFGANQLGYTKDELQGWIPPRSTRFWPICVSMPGMPSLAWVKSPSKPKRPFLTTHTVPNMTEPPPASM